MRIINPLKLNRKYLHSMLAVAASVTLLAAFVLAVYPAGAEGRAPLHPEFAMLDADGNNVLDSGQPVSTMQTCGACHDTTFIAEHNAHAGILSGALDAPAGEAVIIDPQTGEFSALEAGAGDGEMNCFLCHLEEPNNAARLDALQGGDSQWANTATLVGSGLVEQSDGGYVWNTAAFAEDGKLLPDYVMVQDPAVENCGLCHGVATTEAIEPLVLDTCSTEQRTTITTGQIFSPQRMLDSGLNLSQKASLDRSWDVHAERLVGCTDCHYSLNNPAYVSEPDETRPDHLIFDPRRLEPGEYLEKPFHEFARSENDVVTDESCTACHDAISTHQWLPYSDRHMESLACETCHVPRQEAPARQSIDWTVLTASGGPNSLCRGQVDESAEVGQSLIVGYDPVLLPHEGDDGTLKIGPYNLITNWYWAYGVDDTPVALADVQKAYFDAEGQYHTDVVAAFDTNNDGALDNDELFIETAEQEQVIAARLVVQGLDNPHIVSQIDAYPIHHGVTHGDWAVRECTACHGEESRLAAPIVLATDLPGGVAPTGGEGTPFEDGTLMSGPDGTLYYQPNTGQQGSETYIFGHSSVKLIDRLGMLMFIGTLAAVAGHGGLRVIAARRTPQPAPEVREVYMYSVYERLWHWLQTAAILLLIFTGLVIHKPELFGLFSFAYIVQVHNVLAAILTLNAALALFYHLASGEIRQFLPEPKGFFNQAIVQTKFYTQGIFKGKEHPFEKTPAQKMNPLQQITYLGLLNVLLPAQIITGSLMWGAQQWPDIVNRVGGLPLLAPAHTLISWLLTSFVVAHVYLTTTGHEPMAAIKGMIMGWDEVEVHAGAD